MSIELITDNHSQIFDDFLLRTKKQINIVSPFIGNQTAHNLCKYIEEKDITCNIITRFYREDFLNGVSSLEGLKVLLEAGANIFALKDLHSKLYLFDDDKAIIGSTNFTLGGFRFNHELSLALEDEVIMEDLKDYFNDLMIEVADYKIYMKKILEESKSLDSLTKDRNRKDIKYTNNMKFGARIPKHKKKLKSSERDEIEKGYREYDSLDEQVWLKFIGTGNDRYNPNHTYALEDLNGRYVTSFPRNPSGIKKGDFIYLAALSTDHDDNHTPIIIGKARTYGFDKNNVANEKDREKYPWMEKYPYYIELYDVEISNDKIQNGISLNNLFREVGTDLYPGTIGKNLTIANIRTRHYQKSHLKMTNVAKQYIDRLLEDII